MTDPVSEEDLAHCQDLVRLYTRDQYLADLLLPTTLRSDLTVLHAFHAAIIEAINQVTEPVAGEIRLQWWRDVINGERAGEAAGHPVARSLMSVVEKHGLSTQMFDAKLQAHVFELYQDPMESTSMLEGWCGETRSYLFQLASMINGAEVDSHLADACGHAGMADGLTMVLTNLARHRAAGQVFVPKDILLDHNLSAESLFDVPDSRHEALVKALIKLTKQHHSNAVTSIKKLDKHYHNTFRVLGLVPLYLSICRKDPRSVMTGIRTPLQLRRQWALLKSPIR